MLYNNECMWYCIYTTLIYSGKINTMIVNSGLITMTDDFDDLEYFGQKIFLEFL